MSDVEPVDPASLQEIGEQEIMDMIPDPSFDWEEMDRELRIALAAIADEAQRNLPEEQKDYIKPAMELLEPFLIKALQGLTLFGVKIDTVAAAKGIDIVAELADDVEDYIQRTNWDL